MPVHTAPGRTAPRGIACGSQWRPSHTRATESQAAPDPGDPVWLRLFKRVNVFSFSRNPIVSLKNPSKSILTLKIVKPFPENS
jgi:hypothetical protein